MRFTCKCCHLSVLPSTCQHCHQLVSVAIYLSALPSTCQYCHLILSVAIYLSIMRFTCKPCHLSVLPSTCQCYHVILSGAIYLLIVRFSCQCCHLFVNVAIYLLGMHHLCMARNKKVHLIPNIILKLNILKIFYHISGLILVHKILEYLKLAF